MTPARSSPRPIGATQPPDLDLDQLRSIEIDGLDARFELEDAQVHSASLAGTDAGSGRVVRVHFADVDLGESKLRAVRLLDVVAERLDAANSDWRGAQVRRTLFSDARLTGLDFSETQMEQASFKACKLEYANFRHSMLKHVSFEDCVLTAADFQGAELDAVRFCGCELAEADFSKAELSLVDLRGSNLVLAGSVLGLRGAIIDPLQLMELARTLAHELGIVVEDA